jgi:hypothetical protein
MDTATNTSGTLTAEEQADNQAAQDAIAEFSAMQDKAWRSEPEQSDEQAVTAALDTPAEQETKVVNETTTKDTTGTLKPVAETPKADTKPAETKPLTKWEKEQQRQASVLKGFEEKKAAFEAEKKAKEDELAAKERELTAREEAAKAPRYTPEQYETAATKWEADAEAKAVKLEDEGEFDKAEKVRSDAKATADAAREKAKEIRSDPQGLRQQQANRAAEQARVYQQEQAKWQAKIAAEMPELLDATNPAHAELKKFAEELKSPSWIYNAAKLVKNGQAVLRVPVLEKEIEALKAENKRLTELTAVGGGGSPTGPIGETKFEDLSTEEMFKQIYANARATDRGGY